MSHQSARPSHHCATFISVTRNTKRHCTVGVNLKILEAEIRIWTKNQTSKYEGIRSISFNCMRFNKSDKPTQGKKAKSSENIYWFPNIEVSFILSLLLRVRLFKEGVGWGGGEPGEGHCFTAIEWEDTIIHTKCIVGTPFTSKVVCQQSFIACLFLLP